MHPFRIGSGYDVHRLADGLPFVLGGVKIDHTKGAVGHSDADVLLHAICDALLGAAALRDIGFHFPDTSADFKGIDSRLLLQRTMKLMNDHGWQVGNIDCTIALQQPKIAGYIPQMQLEIERIVKSGPGSVSVKATTTEHLGFTGREEGVAAWAVALIFQINQQE